MSGQPAVKLSPGHVLPSKAEIGASTTPVSRSAGSFVALNISESRTWNFVRELERRGYIRVDFMATDWSTAVRKAFTFCKAVRASDFVLCGTALPWQLPWMFLTKLMRRKCVLDCPMDITIWPFPEKTHWKWLVRMALRSADSVLTIRTRAYFLDKLKVHPKKRAYVEHVPDRVVIYASRRVSPALRLRREAFTICLSGGSPPHRLERFLPVFEALIPLVPNVELLVIADEARSVVGSTVEYARRAGFAQRIRIVPVIKPVEKFFATVAQCQMWVATMGDDTLQGQREFRMELLEIGLLARPVLSVRTSGLEEHQLIDGSEVIYIDLSDPRAAAAKIAFFAHHPTQLAQLGLNLQRRVEADYSLDAAGDTILQLLRTDEKARQQASF